MRDHVRIVYLDACYEVPFDTTRALELAFFCTFAVPSIAQLLASTGEFTDGALKRSDDTDLLISTFAENGHDSAVGRAAIRRMNQIHGRFLEEGVTVQTPVRGVGRVPSIGATWCDLRRLQGQHHK